MGSWVTASCLSPCEPSHLAPDESCTCGFYAMKSSGDVGVFAAAIDFEADAARGNGAEGALLGRVLLAGKVIEHDSGYRAERARIAELMPTTTDGGMTRSLAARLGLPVGPTLDTSRRPRRDKNEERWEPPDGPARLGHLEHVLLRLHRRHFRLIQGGAEEDDPGA